MLGYVVINAPSFADISKFAHALYGLVTDRQDYSIYAFDELGVKQGIYHDPLSEKNHLIDIMSRGATTPGYAESLAPMAAAEWLYATWCQRAASERAVDFSSLVGEWISPHDDPASREHAAWLYDELDHIGPMLSPEHQRHIAYLFGRTMELGVAFHTAPCDATARH